jgi:FixJ family two-component response regulator
VVKTVLIIDDHEAAAAAVARIALAAGVSPAVLTESLAFAPTFRTLSPGAVILDVMMPGHDGIEVLRELAAIAPATPVLLMTGHGEVWARMARELGSILGLSRVEIATKPVTRAAVVEFLGSILTEAC